MDFEKNVPEWSAQGTEPPASLKNSGFSAGYKPPAAYFNWFWNGVSACLTELQTKMKQVRVVAGGGTGKSSFTSGNYLIGNGTGALVEKTPTQVLEDIGAAKKGDGVQIVSASSTDGIAYTATVEGVTSLSVGLEIIIIPNIVSASRTPTLNINNLGAVRMVMPINGNTTSLTTMPIVVSNSETTEEELQAKITAASKWISADKPVKVRYDGEYWETDVAAQSATTLYGAVPIESGGTGANTAEQARNKLGVAAINHTHTAADVGARPVDGALTQEFSVTLQAAGWSTEAPYTQTVAVTGILESDNPIADIDVSTATADSYGSLSSAWACVGRITTQTGQITATCYETKPAVDITVRLMVVR